MSNESTQVLTIASLERLKLSANGNPRFRVTFTDGRTAETKPDAPAGYVIENSEFDGVPAEVTFDAAGRILRVKVVNTD